MQLNYKKQTNHNNSIFKKKAHSAGDYFGNTKIYEKKTFKSYFWQWLIIKTWQH